MKKKKIAITYEKGGVAKTTTAVNVSSILAEQGAKVLLIDLDHQSYATSYFGMYDDTLPSVLEVMKEISTVKQAIRSTPFAGLHLLPATYRLREIETFLMMKMKQQEYTLKKAISSIENEYDYIFFDCPPSGERIKTNALAAADAVILPTIPDDYAVHGLMCMSTEIVDIKRDVNPSLLVLGVLITIFENTINKRAYAEALREQNIFKCFDTVIRKNTTLSEAINHRKPINHYNKKCTGYEDYKTLTQEFMKLINREIDFSHRTKQNN